jgi:hypothetical protein
MRNFVRVILGFIAGILIVAATIPLFVNRVYDRGYNDGYGECVEDVKAAIRYEMYKRGMPAPPEMLVPDSGFEIKKDTAVWQL